MNMYFREEPEIVAAAERQMRGWALHEESANRSMRRANIDEKRQTVFPYVAISREAGAGGSEIGQRVAVKLGWKPYDGNLLDLVARRYSQDRQMLELVDETESNWVYDVLGTWMDRRIVPHEKFLRQLVRTVTTSAREGSGVFVGRGAQFLLPRDRGLAVRLVAPLAFRAERIAKQKGLELPAARTYAEEVDRGRAEFVQRFFHRDIADPHLYDMVINVQWSGIESAADQIVAAVRERWH